MRPSVAADRIGRVAARASVRPEGATERSKQLQGFGVRQSGEPPLPDPETCSSLRGVGRQPVRQDANVCAPTPTCAPGRQVGLSYKALKTGPSSRFHRDSDPATQRKAQGSLLNPEPPSLHPLRLIADSWRLTAFFRYFNAGSPRASRPSLTNVKACRSWRIKRASWLMVTPSTPPAPPTSPALAVTTSSASARSAA